MDSVLLSVAPVSASATEINPEKIARDVIACEKAGAGMVHLHARDWRGKLTADLSVLEETIRLIRKESNIIIEVSTGGVSELSIEERCAPLALPQVECASLNVGSVNLGRNIYKNSPDDVEYCVKQILNAGKIPEAEVFEIGMIHTALSLYDKFKLRPPLLCSIVLGHKGAAPATIKALAALQSFIPDGMLWGITHYRRQNSDIISAAVAMGACTVRVGFEDSDIIDNGVAAQENAPIVGHFKNLLQSMGKRAMLPEEARQMLEINLKSF